VLIAHHRTTHPRDRHPHAAAAVGATIVALMAVATSIGLSRVYLGVHFPGDVAAGAILGGAIGTLGGRAYSRGAAARLALWTGTEY
jgi:membrane-associated phospholipid phosphatase